MRILFLTDNFPPEVNAPATRTYEHCVEWVKLGAEVTVITCFPNFPKGKIYNGYQNKLYQKEIIDGIRVIRVWSYMSPNTGFVKRVFDFMSYAFMAFLLGVFQKCDLIIGTTPQFFTAISASCLAFIKRRPWVMEVRDLWPESIVAVGAMKRQDLAFKFLRKIEIKLYHSANLIIVVTDQFKKYISSLNVVSSKIFIIKNGVIHSNFIPSNKNNQLLEKHGLTGKFIVSYIGTHGMAHALDFILNCANTIKDPKIHFILQGDGSEKQHLMEIAAQLNLKNITFLPFVSKSEISKYINLSDVALVNLKRSETFKTVIPSKIFENVALYKPILLGVEGEAKDLIEHYKVGVCYIPESQSSFIEALEEIKSYKTPDFELNCNEMLQQFDRNKFASIMLDVITKTLHK
jgi:glycosyltransferase involved in cell wall biosynthesis|tara:strand:- start:503 stop:1714 length:1212 start_codon:yes stop_codon:yes gene_type:complete